MNIQKKRAIPALAVSLLLLAPLAACSTNEPEAPTNGDGSLAPVRAVFTQIYGVPSIGNAAQDLGIWEDAGLKVELTEGRAVVESLVTNSADIAWSSPTAFIAAIDQGAGIKMIGPTSNVFDQYIIAGSDLAADSIEELEPGLKVGVTSVGSSGNYGMAKLAEQLGWTADDYETLILGDLDSLRAALSQGTIDVFTWSAGAAFALRDSGDAKLLGHLGDVVGPFPFGMLAASQDAIDSKPDSIRTFCEGYFEAQGVMKEDPEQAFDILVEKGGLDPSNGMAIVESGLGFQAESDEVPDEAWESMAEATMATIPEVQGLTGDDIKEMFVPCSSL